MSSFVVSEDTMRRAVRAICSRNWYGQIISTFAGIDTSAPTAPTEIGRRLFTLNIEAVYQRYPDTQDTGELPGEDDSLSMPRTFRAPKPATVQAPMGQLAGDLKALGCLRYQCSEGDVPNAPLFVALAEAIGVLSYDIVSRMPEYERAPWG